MGTLAHPSTDAAVHRIPNTSEMHNASVDEVAAREGECAQVHLPTGRTCALPHGHERSCEFISAEAALASLAHHRADDGRLQIRRWCAAASRGSGWEGTERRRMFWGTQKARTIVLGSGLGAMTVTFGRGSVVVLVRSRQRGVGSGVRCHVSEHVQCPNQGRKRNTTTR